MSTYDWNSNPWVWCVGFKRVTDDKPEVKHRPILFSGPMVRAILEGRKTQTRRVVKFSIPSDSDEVFFWSPSGTTNGAAKVAMAGLWARRNARGDDDTSGWLKEIGPCPYGQPGDRLWVRETWRFWEPLIEGEADPILGRLPPYDDWATLPDWQKARICERVQYRAEDPTDDDFPWRPSIHMPRWASRLTLEVVSVRVQRLQEISEEDARAEGVEMVDDPFQEGNDYWRCYEHNDPDDGECAGVLGARDSFRTLWDSINGARSPRSRRAA